MVYQLLNREFVPPKANILVRAGAFVILACVPKKRRETVRQRLLGKLTRYNSQTDFEIAAIETMASLARPFSAKMLDSYTNLPFEDGQFMCFATWDDHLHRKFGDYMQLPPEEERAWRHHPIMIDFERNYEELL